MPLGCIGYGSLIWKPGNLAPHLKHPGRWLANGPALPLEFARESSRNRITLVIVPGHPACTTYWTPFHHDEVDTARKQLAHREGCEENFIGLMTATGRAESALPPALRNVLRKWMEENNLDGVVWTELPCGFKERREQLPTMDEVCAYLDKRIERGEHQEAEEYIRKAPLQIATSYREQIEQHLGWTPLADH